MQERSLDTEDDMVGTIIQDDEIQQDYEPSEREIMSYAVQLGMKPEEDKEFLFIAREGLKAPVPKPWSACVTKDGRIFYYNLETGDSQWDHPSDQSYKEKFERLKFGQHAQQKSKTLFLNKSEFSMSEIVGSHAGEINILNSKNFPESLNFSGITPHNEENIAKQSISHRSNILSDEFRRNLEVNTHEKHYSSHNAEQQQIESDSASKKDAWSEISLINQEQKENRSQDPLNARIDSEDLKNMNKTLNTEEAYEENMLGELEVSSISAFQKYEDDLKIQLSYVLSEFERNYQDHAAKIEEHYQKEIIRSQNDTDNLKSSEVMDFQKEIRSFENKIKGENEEDLKNQIAEVNLQYEAKRKEMEERAEKEIHQCLHEVREKCQDIGQLNKAKMKPHHKRSSSALPQVKSIGAGKGEINQIWNEKKAGVEIEYQAKCLRLEKELVNGIETSLENFRKEVHRKFENEGQLYDCNEANMQDQLGAWKVKLENEYQDKLRVEKEKLEQEYLSSKQELEISLNQKETKNSAVIAVENNLKAEFETKLKAIKLEKTLLEQQYQKLREITHQQAKEKLEFVKECLNSEENELAAKIKLELKSLDKQIADREALLSWLKDDKKAADEIETAISEKEKSIKAVQKETDCLEEEVSQLKSQVKQKTAESQENQKNKTAEKDLILNKINDLSKRIDRVEVEIGLIRQKPQEPSKLKAHTSSHNMNMGALHSQLGFNKIFRGVQEIRKVLAQKTRRSTSVEKVQVEELEFEIPSSAKYNKTGLRGFGGFNARRSSLEPKSELGDSYMKDYTIERASPVRIKQNIRQIQNSSTKKLLPSESKMMSFEWEEEEKADQKICVQQRKVSQEYQTKISQSPSKIQSDWKSLINIEKGLLVKYNHIVQKKKIETRIIQNTLEREQRDYKVEYVQYKNDPYKTYSKKLKLEILKKALNAKIQDYNKALSWLRSQEGVMTSKQELLRNLEKSFEKSCKEENFDEDALFYLYKVFKSVQLDLTVSEEFDDIRSISFLK